MTATQTIAIIGATLVPTLSLLAAYLLNKHKETLLVKIPVRIDEKTTRHHK